MAIFRWLRPFRRLRAWVKSISSSLPFFSRKKAEVNTPSPARAVPNSADSSTDNTTNTTSSTSNTPSIFNALAQSTQPAAFVVSAPITQPLTSTVSAPITQPSTSQAENPFKKQEDTKKEIEIALNDINKNVKATSVIQKLTHYLHNKIAPVEIKSTLRWICDELNNYPKRLVKNDLDKEAINVLKNKVQAHLDELTDDYITSLTTQNSNLLTNKYSEKSNKWLEIETLTVDECKKRKNKLEAKLKNPLLKEGKSARIRCQLVVLNRHLDKMTKTESTKMQEYNKRYERIKNERKAQEQELARVLVRR